ncbi:MAG: translocation/assembly module TamB domain-containing protein [Muribaculaceae bacterium]|nr:translocation/assembly module TamB domain-containing protein [Muribaculaceae bacterium]
MGKTVKNKIWKTLKWILGILLVLIIALPFLLYIPWVQNKAKDIACHYMKEKTGMDLNIGRILIKFPLDIAIDDMTLIDEFGDTMVVAKKFTANVAVKPLLDKRFEIDGAELEDGKYRLVSNDASMMLRADVKHCKLTGANIDLDNHKINLLDGELYGGDVKLALYSHKSYQDNDTTKSEPWRIEANRLVLKDIDYSMLMEPTIHEMKAHLARAELKDGCVDTGEHTVNAKSLMVDSIDCKYIYPNERLASAYEKHYPTPPKIDDPNDTLPWTVRSDTLTMKGGHAIYAEKGKTPGQGLDMSHVEVSDLDFTVTDFYNRGSIVSVPIKELKAKERGGLEIRDAHGKVDVNPQDIQVKDFTVKTKNSSIDLDGKVDMSIFDEKPTGSMNITTDASVDLREINSVMPSLSGVTKFIPKNHPVKFKGKFEGNTRDLDINNGELQIPGFVKTKVDGNIKNLTDPSKLQADVNLDANIDNIDFAKNEFLSKDLQKQVNVVPMNLKGNIKYNPKSIAGNVDMRLKSGGSLVGKGSYEFNSDRYTVDATAKSLPVKKLVPQLDVNNVTAHIKADGHGFDFLGKNTSVNAQINLDDIDYAGKHYRNYDADVKLNGTNFDAKVKARNRGHMAAKGSFDPKTEKYDIDATFNSFPVNEIAPQLGVGNLTAAVKAKGQKFDLLNPNTRINADIDLQSVVYNNQTYKDLQGNITLDGNAFNGHINSVNPNCDVYADVNGTIHGDTYNVNLKGNIRDLDLQAMKIMDTPCNGSGDIEMHGQFNLKTNEYQGTMSLNELNWTLDEERFYTEQADIAFDLNKNSSTINFDEQSNHIDFSSPHSVNDLMKSFDRCIEIAKRQYKKVDLDVNEIADEVPQFDLKMKMGPRGIIQRYVGKWDIDFRDLQADLSKDSTLHAHAVANNLGYGTHVIDKLIFNIEEVDKMIGYNARMENKKGSWDEMAQVDIAGYAKGSNVNMLLSQKNIDKETGYHIGINAIVEDSMIYANVLPHQPIIAYKQCNLNDSNFVKIDFGDKRLEADITLERDSSLLSLKTDPIHVAGKQNILANIKNFRIEEWTKIVPSLESVSGIMDADIALSYDGRNFEGDGEIELHKFTYNRMPEGDLKMKTNLTIDPRTSSTNLTANLNIDGSDVAVAYGALNDSTAASPMNVKVDLNKFPLRKVSPFIPGRMVMLDGYANGQLSVDGSLDNPLVNGFLVSDTAYVKLPRYGSSLRLSEKQIDINDNVIEFVNYQIYGLNNNSAKLNGTVDFKSIDDIKMDLDLKGKNIQFFGSVQKPYSQIFGDGFIDIDGDIKSRNNLTAVNANAKLLAGSNITYVMQDDINSVVSSSATEGMVSFINPNDTAWYNETIITGGTTSSALNILVNIDVEQGAKINAFLQPEGKDRVTVDGTGRLRYLLDFAGKEHLSGTYTASSGVVRYTPPVISQKVFNLVEGSSLTWNGEMLNPQLNLKATNSVRTSVNNTNGSGSRLVDFDIIATLTNTLSNIDLKIDLEAKNDATVESELQTLTESQRSQTAINLLLYNSYSGSMPTGDFSTTGALFSFLQSQINNWTANNLKGVDLSFGINQYEGSQKGSRIETSYSYRLSKSLFGERFKIAVGGEYSTEATSEQNFSQNLISDISFEYLLNPTGTRYLRLFRHKGLESVLEGEVTVTGISFVMKHKLSSIKDLFNWMRKSKKTEPEPTPIDNSDNGDTYNSSAPASTNSNQ